MSSGSKQKNGRQAVTRWQVIVLLVLVLLAAAWAVWRYRQSAAAQDAPPPVQSSAASTAVTSAGPGWITLDSLPMFSGEPWVAIEDNVPDFSDSGMNSHTAFEYYSELDALGRCGPCWANVCPETMPDDARESISSVKPSGWVQAQYDFVDGKSLYNRCHLLGFQLTAENANKQNLITGTRYLNVIGMLPFENMVADYVKETEGHVYYRVTPIFDGKNLVADGVRMEGWSVEDEGESVCFDVFCYNNQPGVRINYADGTSQLWTDDPTFLGETRDYILNTGSKKFHLPTCSGAPAEGSKNRQEYTGTREMLVAQGFTPCGQCKP